ncbi:MAG TPA: lamin tail domain-containing protein, partial [Candidatus Acidoferrum sp.]|nr:lamin tail domain-containing protein [Candidatus Acidoferrum sp.]
MQKFWLAALVAVLLGCAPAKAAVVINEFLAQNDGGLRDSDIDSPDWIELHNNGFSPASLAGWHLTDNITNLTKWTFPPTNMAENSFLIVFASGKDRATNGGELHANFQLNEDGGYLALVDSNGLIVSAFSYPPQHRNVSFGPVSTIPPSAMLLYADAMTRSQVPANGSLGLTWTMPGFDASTWSNTTPPLRFNSGPAPGAPVLSVDFNTRTGGEAGAANTETGFSTMTLNANPSTFGAITVQLSALSGGVLDDRDRAVPAQTATLLLDQIYDDFIFVTGQTNGNGARIQITGLTPNTNYQLTVWSYDNSSSGARVSDWIETASGVTRDITNGFTFDGAVVPTRDTEDTFGGALTSSPTGGLTVEGRRSGGTSHGVFLNGLQLAPFTGSTVSGNLASMFNNNASVYTRFPFSVSGTNGLASMTLRVKYNGGFVAYLNGTEVARRHAPETVDWNSTATAPHSAAVAEDIAISFAIGLLTMGTNVLAVQGLNLSADNGDFFLEPQLIGVLTPPATNAFYSPSTPGTSNGIAYFGVVPDTKFSVDRGFYDAPFSLSITSATASATIYFTTNGGEPSPTSGSLYSAPINITGNSFVRAQAFAPGWIPSGVDTHSYIFLRDVLRQSNNIPGYPAVWVQGSYPADYEMDSNLVNHPFYGTTLSNDLRSIPVLSIVTDFDGLWGNTRGIYTHPTSTHDFDSGQDWERAASAELILPEGANGKTAFAVNCALRMQGNASRDNARTPKHSFRLLFKGEYGPTKLGYDWFPGNVDEFDNIILRAGGFVDGWPSRYSDSTVFTGASGESVRGQRYRPENSSYLRDGFAKATHGDMGWLAGHGTWVHLYINGLYWGIYNPSERLDSAFMAEHVGGNDFDWDVLVGDDAIFNAAVADGSKDDWNAMMSAVNAGVASESEYQAVAQ